MKSAVITFPGSNCDRDAVVYLKNFFNYVKLIDYRENSIDNYDLIVIPGGFSFGDYLRSGAIAAKSPIAKCILKHAEDGRYIIGICNGFQILTELRILPGSLIKNNKLKFIGKNCFIKKFNNSIFNSSIESEKILNIPVAHNDGCYYLEENSLKSILDNEQVAFRYCSENGDINELCNINGSLFNIAGVTNVKKNVLGLMPHPERAFQKFHISVDGIEIIKNFFL